MKLIPGTLSLLLVTATISGASFANPARQAAPKIEDEAEAEADVAAELTSDVLYSCTSEASGEWDYQYTLNVSEGSLEVLQQSTNARYRALQFPIQQIVPAGEIPSVEPKFTCVYGPIGTYDYRATIQVFEDSIFVLQSSMIGRYAPLYYALTPEIETETQTETEVSADVK